MGLSTSLIPAHDDALHSGNAKRAIASGVASLDAASKVVQEPASKGAASGIASLDASSRVPAAQLALAELLANKNASSGYAGLDASSQVAQVNSFLAVPSMGVAKAKDTEYQNGSRPRLLIVTVKLNVGATGTSIVVAGMYTKASAGVANTDNPTVVSNNEFGAAVVATTAKSTVLVKIIPASWYYKLITFVTSTGAVTMVSWDEIEL